MNIVFSLDDNYAILLNAAMASILRNASAEDTFDFYVLHNNLSPAHQEALACLQAFHPFNIYFIAIDEEKHLAAFAKPTIWANKVCYYRLIAPIVVNDYAKQKDESIERILYLDADILVMSTLSELFAHDLRGKELGAVRSPIGEEERSHIATLPLNTNHKYFYAGLLLIDVEKWIASNIVAKAITVQGPRELKWADMDILNMVFDNNNYTTLPARYSIWPGLNVAPYEYEIDNYYRIYEGVYSTKEVEEAFYKPVVYQLAGGAKPWRECATQEVKTLFYQYSRQTEFERQAKEYVGAGPATPTRRLYGFLAELLIRAYCSLIPNRQHRKEVRAMMLERMKR